MAFMDFLPQFGDNTDQSVTDPTLQAINLKRKLALADSLRNAKMPQGQMVGDRYVAPSWTQYLAGAVDKGMAGYQEDKAIKEYSDYQKTQQDKMANALKTLSGAFEPKTISNTTMQTQDVPLAEGMNVGTSPFGTTDQVAQIAPKFDINASAPQNMSGTTTQSTPVTTTSTMQPTLSDIEKAFGQYATEVKDPKMLASLLTGRYEKMVKANEPIKLGAGESVFSSTGTKIFGNPKEGKKYTDIQTDKAGNTFGLNTETNQFEQLPGAKMATENWSAPYKVGGEYLQKNANTGEIRKAYGTSDGDKAPAGYTWSTDAKGQKTLTSIPGGPADKALNPNKEQSDAYTYSTRMESADKILNSLEGKYDPFSINIKTSGKTALIPGGQTVANKFLLNSIDQQAEQAQRNFINAVLRRESGATIQPHEFESANMQYFPQPGDGADVLAQKRQNRREAIDGLKKAAGPVGVKPAESTVIDFKDL
jgi:hypothetical protein